MWLPILRQCRYVFIYYQTDRLFSTSATHHRYGRMETCMPGRALGLYLPPVPGSGFSPLTVLADFRRGPPPAIIQTFRTFCHADFLSCGFSVIQKAAFCRYPARPRRLLPCPLSLMRSLFQKFAQIGQGGFPPLVLQHVEASPKALWSWDGWCM